MNYKTTFAKCFSLIVFFILGNNIKSSAQSQGYLDTLIAYKQTNHQIMGGWFRAWEDSAAHPPNGSACSFRSMPDSLDFVIDFGDRLANDTVSVRDSIEEVYVPYLHARGTKVLRTFQIDLPSNYTQDSVGWAAYAKFMMDTFVTKMNLDGLDIDVEDNVTGQQLTNRVGVYTALSHFLGPKSGTGKLLTFNTNQPATNHFFQQVYTLMNYVLFQHYGGSATDLQGIYNGFAPYIAPSQFIPAFSFYEENGTNWGDVDYPDQDNATCYNYARWQPTQGRKGGLIAYAIDRDIPYKTNSIIPSDFHVTRKIISQILNPAVPASPTKMAYFYQQYISTGDVTQLKNATTFTIEAWAKFKVFGNTYNAVLAKSNTTSDRIVLEVKSNGSLYAIVGNGSSSYGQTAAGTVDTGQWYHFAMVYDGSQSTNANKLKLYINGVLQTLTFTGTIPAKTSTTNTASFIVGSETTTSTNTYFSGTIDEVRVWDTALTQPTITTWMNETLGKCHTNFENLSLYWKLDTVVDSIVTPSLGTKYTGTIGGIALYFASSQAAAPNTCALADFTCDTTHIFKGQSVTFQNTSANANTYIWNFVGGTPASSTATNPVVTYNISGNYSVQLIASSATGSDTIIKSDYILVQNATAVNNPTIGSQKITVYPNPTRKGEYVSFIFPDSSHNEKQLLLYNALGMKIKALSTTENQYHLSTQDISPGIYFYTYSDKNTISINGFIVIQ